MQAVFFWEAAGLSLDRANPYGALLARALAAEGVELVAGHAHEFDQGWIRENQGKVDILHLNWPHYMYDAPDLAGRVVRAEALVTNLVYARRLGYKVVWTVHNLYPHDSAHFELDRLVRLAVTHLSDAIIVHCDYARAQVAAHFHRTEGIYVIPHGHFIDAYPNEINREAARDKLGLNAEHLVYFFFGNVRRYKGLDRLLEVFCALPGDDLRLLLGAKVYSEYGEQFVEDAAQTDRRVILRPSRFFANQEFQWLFNAADVGVFPFADVLTSGSTITALSFGLPVIVPAVGCLPELVNGQAGVVYDPADPDALRQAMLSIRTCDLASLRQAAMQRAHCLDWTPIARRTLDAYRR